MENGDARSGGGDHTRATLEAPPKMTQILHLNLTKSPIWTTNRSGDVL